MVRKKLGVSDKVSAFVVPVGATVNMNGSCLQTMLTIILLMKIFSVPVTASLLIRLMLITFLLSVGSPGVTNSSLVVLTLLLSIIGLPTSALGLVIGIWNIVDRVATVNNVNGDIATSVIVSAAEKDLDIETYHAKNLRSVEQ
jgi:Na+/H+-dicarboxylate symporter